MPPLALFTRSFVAEPHRFDKIANFRDFGGVATLDGGEVRRGRLFRAAHLASASDADLQRLNALGITLVADLRRPKERRTEPNRLLPGGVTVLSNDLGAEVEAPHIAFLRRGDPTDAAVERYLLDYYEDAADQPRHRALFASSLKALEALEGGFLVHCAAGKDRTGILVALIQTVLGVPEPAILEEYLRTNAIMLTAERIAATEAKLHAMIGHAPGDAAVHALLGVQAHHLRHALNSVAARHGSVAAARSRIRARLVQMT